MDIDTGLIPWDSLTVSNRIESSHFIPRGNIFFGTIRPTNSYSHHLWMSSRFSRNADCVTATLVPAIASQGNRTVPFVQTLPESQRWQRSRDSPSEFLTPMPQLYNGRWMNAQRRSRRRDPDSMTSADREALLNERVGMLETRLAQTLTIVRNVQNALPADLEGHSEMATQPFNVYVPSTEDHASLLGNPYRTFRRRRRGRGVDNTAEKKRRRDFEQKLKKYLVLTFQMEAKDVTCSICLETINLKEECKKLSRCGHIFHSHCLDRWFEVRQNCPNCRREPFMGMF